MPREATGVLLRRGGYFAARVWVGSKRPVLAMHPSLDEHEAFGVIDNAGHLEPDSTLRAEHFRAALRKAKVDRPELFEDNEHRQQIRVHDLCATFITLALANGRTGGRRRGSRIEPGTGRRR